jgi:hypothetical protein
MTASEFETLRADVLGLRADVDRHFAEIDRQFAQVDAKLDAKPSIAALYQAVVTLMFALSGMTAGAALFAAGAAFVKIFGM